MNVYTFSPCTVCKVICLLFEFLTKPSRSKDWYFCINIFLKSIYNAHLLEIGLKTLNNFTFRFRFVITIVIEVAERFFTLCNVRSHYMLHFLNNTLHLFRVLISKFFWFWFKNDYFSQVILLLVLKTINLFVQKPKNILRIFFFIEDTLAIADIGVWLELLFNFFFAVFFCFENLADYAGWILLFWNLHV